MNQVSATKIAKAKNLYFKTTDTPRGTKLDLNSLGGNYVIDIDGTVYEISESSGESASITIVGGIDTFVNEKKYRPYVTYLTQRQKMVLYSILKELAQNTIKAEVSAGDNTMIDSLVKSVYRNYCG
jgi:D-arabinose 1-dehydrogenase-like Zn-dependent alcohol dehydrogenase